MDLRRVKAEVGGRILCGELVRVNGKSAVIRFVGKKGVPFTIKRHMEKHRVKFLDGGVDVRI